MPFIGNKPSAVPLTSADIADSIITSAKIVDATIANADIANSTINLTTKVTGTLPVANGGTGLAALGTSLQVLRTNTGATALEFATVTGTVFGSALLHVRDEKSQGTNGGSSSSGNNTRVLNTVKTNEISGASLASNTITLPSGTYFINAYAPGYQTYEHKLRLRNTTDSSYTLEGVSMFLSADYNGGGVTCLFGRFTITAQKDFQLYNYISAATASNGLGRASSQGTEVYADVMIWKVS
jgi:hypothetical protein